MDALGDPTRRAVFERLRGGPRAVGEIASWWPVETHSIDGGTPIFEPQVGGRLYERAGDAEHFWGRIVAWEPPRRLALEWKVNPNAAATTDLEVTFLPDGDTTRVELV